MVESLSFSNFFSHFYIIHHDKETLRKEDQNIALIFSVFLGFFTLGLMHFGCWIAEKCIKPENKSEPTPDGAKPSTADRVNTLAKDTDPLLASQHPVPVTTKVKQDNLFKSASVLPYYYNVREKEVYYLIGLERKPPGQEHKQRWGDCGGRKENIDKRPSDTALREFDEETIGAFPFVIENIKLSLRATVKIEANLQAGLHVFYVTALNPKTDPKTPIHQMHFDDACKIGENHAQLLKKPGLHHSQLEKVQLAWMKASELLSKLPPKGQNWSEAFNNFTIYEAPHEGATRILNQKIRFCMGEAWCKIKSELDSYDEHIRNGFATLQGQQVKIQ